MLVSELVTEVALHCHDEGNAELSAANLFIMVNSAARDARHTAGWLIRLEDDETLEAAENDWEYDVPASFAYIEKLLIEETVNSSSVYTTEIPRHTYEVRLNGGVPVFAFSSLQFLQPGKNIKVIGQKRATIYTATSNTIDPGMESFLRERTLYFAFRYMAAGLSELAAWRRQMSIQCWQTSEAFLRRHPQEFRMMPSAIEVPGRG